MQYRPVTALLIALSLPWSSVANAQKSQPRFDVQPLGDSVYAIIRREPLGFAGNGNTLVIVCDSDVVVVDTDFTREAAREVIVAIRRITKKVVRFVVNTHWHDDHVMGNQAYQDAYPGVQFIAQENTRDALMHDAVTNRKQQLEQAPAGLAYFRDVLKQGKSLAGGALGEDERATWTSTIAIMQQYVAEAPTARTVLPSITFADRLTLTRGSRTIQILYFGPANTRGDAVVFLPKERIVATGDLVVAPIPFTFNSNISPWISALDRLRELGARMYMPGHGPLMRDDSYIGKVQRLLESVSVQTRAAVAHGDSLAQARKSVDLTSFQKDFAGDNPVLQVLFSQFVTGPAVGQGFAEAASKRPSPDARLACRTASVDTATSFMGSSATPAVTTGSSLSGADCYRAMLKQVGGADVSLDSMYAEAVRQRMLLTDRVKAAGAALFGTSMSAIEVLRRVRSDSIFVLSDPDSVLAAYAAQLERARRAIPPLFVDAPDEPLDLKAIPRAQASTSAPAAYVGGANGARAAFLVNAYQPGGIAKMNVMMGIAHEAYPGHHFQKLYADLHKANGSLAGLSNTAYVEGWGIYAEQLADEVGLYDTPLSRLGYLTHLYDVFMALQIDIGIHARGWTRAQAVDSMEIVAGRPHAQAVIYANRHVSTAGQLASYGIGYLAIKTARDSAAAVLGSRFSLPEFHDVVLRDGVLTLPQLRQNVLEWTVSKGGPRR